MTTINSLAALKRHCQLGVTLTMVRNDWCSTGPLIGVPRKIISVKSNAIALEKEGSERGSWLYWPKASEMQFTDKGFVVSLNRTHPQNPSMEYEYS